MQTHQLTQVNTSCAYPSRSREVDILLSIHITEHHKKKNDVRLQHTTLSGVYFGSLSRNVRRARFNTERVS